MKKIVWFLIALFWVLLDQYSKIWSVTELKDKQQVVDILPVLRLYYAENHGAAFGMLAEQGGWQKWFFLLVGGIAALVLISMIIKSKNNSFWYSLGLASILGGAIGNVYDRSILGYVRDMISVYYESWDFYFAIFNIADTAITIGVGCLIIDMLFFSKKDT